MATITLRDTRRSLTDESEIRGFLRPFGIAYEQWPVARATGSDEHTDAAAILARYAPEIERLKTEGGYLTADVINVTPDLPGLQAMLDRFNQEHTHAEDEVRFVVQGRGVFHIHPPGEEIFAIEVEAGDLINVPAGTAHWFDLCADRTITAIRLFRGQAGWTPAYTDTGAASRYAPLCLGPEYLPGGSPRLEPLSLPSLP